MRSENEDQCLVPQSKSDDTTLEFYKKAKCAYTRDFLFSFAELDTCKKLPTGFDSSILRELDDQSVSMLHSYHDSDAGRFRSSPSHCSLKNPALGLLGSGASARVPRGVAETSDPVLESSGFHLLNRSNEPYRPPHLYKAKYYSGGESKDHSNEEIFGSSDNPSQERAEEDKQKRDSFKWMRKEQEMATQEKQKIISDEHKEHLKPDFATILEDSRVDQKVADMYSKSKGSEPCDVKGHSENPALCSSNLTHPFLKGEKKTAADQEVIEHDTTNFSFGTNGIAHDLMKSASTPVTKEISMELYSHCNSGVLSYECLEESTLSEINGYCSTQHHLINGKSTCHIEGSHSICSNFDAASQHFLSLLQKGAGLTDLAESSKLNVWSLDNLYVSETADDNNQFNKSGEVCKNNFEKNLHEPTSGTLIRDSEFIALSGTQKDLTSRCKGNEILLPVGHNCSIPLTVNESGSIGDVEGIMFSSIVKQSGVCERDGNLLVSDIQAKVGIDLQTGPETKQSSLSSFDELDICLPDKESLLAVDDYMFPQDSMFVPAGDTSCAPVDTFERLADCGVAIGDKESDPAGFGRPTSFHGSHDLVSLETSFKSLSIQQSYSQLQHSQLKTAKARVSHFKSQESQKGSRIKPKDLKTYPDNLQSLQYCPTNVHPASIQHLQAAATGFGNSVKNQLLQESTIPGYFPPHQLYGRPKVAFPQHTSNEMACYIQDQNAMLNSSPSFNQQCYRDLENARHFEMGIESKADASSYYGGPCAGSVWQTG